MSAVRKINRKQEAVIAALLTEPTQVSAAAKAGVSEATLQRWLRLPDFQAEYRKARQTLVDNTIIRLQQTTTDALATLQRNLACGHPPTEVRAAAELLGYAFKATELDCAARLDGIEQALRRLEPSQ